MSKQQLQQKPQIRVTRDSGANVKILKALELEGYIQIFDVMLENGRENNKIREKILPILIFDHSRLGECVLAGDDCTYDEILTIIGRKNIEDAMHLEAHIRNGYDYFVTEDNDFLRKLTALSTRFNVKIVTPDKLAEICHQL